MFSPPVSPSSPDHMPTTPVEAPSQRYEARIEEGKLYYDKRWYIQCIRKVFRLLDLFHILLCYSLILE